MDEKGAIVELKIPSDPNLPEAPCIAFEIKKETYVPIYDLQGNITCLLDHQRRKIVETYRYSAYGEEEIVSVKGKILPDSSVGNPWRYRGKRIDKETGLVCFGYRYYDAKIGRWITPDPLGTIDGPNLYAYARNNPVTYIDYFGLAADTNENLQACVCGYCLRGDGFCHCMGSDPTHNIETCDCIGIPCIHKRAISVVKTGNTIVSAFGGIGHGFVDFVVGSIHDLQTAAAYMGASELELTLQERIQMIEAIEQSQARQMEAVGNWMMDMLSIDESDDIYQSFRSNTTFGLEVGSLVAGGYGAIKGVVALNRLAKMPTLITKTAKAISHVPSNPLKEAKYTKKVLRQMENNLKTGTPDFHGFPRIVDNYAGLGKTELIKGKDGITRVKISLKGGYKGQEGCFEWILEPDKSVNHRIFSPNP